MPVDRTEVLFIEPLDIAKEVKYWLQETSKNSFKSLPPAKQSAKGLYLAHKKQFDTMSVFFRENHVQLNEWKSYVAFVFRNIGCNRYTLDRLLDTRNVFFFKEDLKIKALYRKAYDSYLRCAKNLAKEAVKYGVDSTTELLRRLIQTGQLSTWYFSGKLSPYYLAALDNFRDYIPKLRLLGDCFADAEFEVLLQRWDNYALTINKALSVFRGSNNTIELTDKIIKTLKEAGNPGP